MDLTLNPDQQSLQSAIRDVLRKLWTPDDLRAAAEGAPFNRNSWATLADLGVFGLTRAEDDGGMGLGMVDAAIVFEELGRALVPGPLVPTLLVSGLISGADKGEAIAASVDLSDSVLIAEHFDAVTHVVLVDDSGLFLLPAAECAARPLDRPLDPLTPVWALAKPDNLGPRIGSATDVVWWRAHGALLTSAFQVGVAQGALDLAVRYAMERVQFDRVIGSFQAVKHLLAESLVKVDVARAAVLVAALETDGLNQDAAGQAISAAKTLADKAATDSGRCCVQVHGGMGFTWEVLAHFYLKRAWLLSTCFGTADDHALRLAAAASPAGFADRG